MTRESLNWWLTLFANLGVLGGLIFVGFEIRQNTSQLRTEGARALTEMVNTINSGVYSDPGLAEIIIRGEQDLTSLSPVERQMFDRYQFSLLNTAEYVLDLEAEGVSGLNFDFVDVVVNRFSQYPGLQEFIRENESNYNGSQELLDLILDR